MEKSTLNYHNIKIPKEGSQFIFLSVILIDSVFETDKNYCPQYFQKNVSMLLKKKRFLNILLTIQKFPLILINKILIKKILMKKILIKKVLVKKILMKKIKTFCIYKNRK